MLHNDPLKEGVPKFEHLATPSKNQNKKSTKVEFLFFFADKTYVGCFLYIYLKDVRKPVRA